MVRHIPLVPSVSAFQPVKPIGPSLQHLIVDPDFIRSCTIALATILQHNVNANDSNAKLSEETIYLLSEILMHQAPLKHWHQYLTYDSVGAGKSSVPFDNQFSPADVPPYLDTPTLEKIGKVLLEYMKTVEFATIIENRTETSALGSVRSNTLRSSSSNENLMNTNHDSPPILDARRRHRSAKSSNARASNTALASERARYGDSESMDIHNRAFDELVAANTGLDGITNVGLATIHDMRDIVGTGIVRRNSYNGLPLGAVHRGGGGGNDAVEEWDERDDDEDAAIATDEESDDDDFDDPVLRGGKGTFVDKASVFRSVDKASNEDKKNSSELAFSTPTRNNRSNLHASRGPPSSARAISSVDDLLASLDDSSVPLPNRDTVDTVTLTSSSEPLSEYTSGMDSLPMAIIGSILSFLPMSEILRASFVCKDWNTEVRTASSISTVDFGEYFSGMEYPDPIVVDSVARNISGRDYSFANCLWLTSGALLHILRVPFGITPYLPLPSIPDINDNANFEGREKSADDYCQSMQNGEQTIGNDNDWNTNTEPGTHSFLRLFCGEYLESELVNPTLQSSNTGTRSLSNTSQPSVNLASLPDQAVWWRRILSGYRQTLLSVKPNAIPPEPWLPLKDACLFLIQSKVVSNRARRQYRILFQWDNNQQNEDQPMTNYYNSNFTDVPFGAVVARSYLEMSFGMRSMVHRFLNETTETTSSSASTATSNLSSSESLSLLLSRRSLMNAPPVVAASTVFSPINGMRNKAVQLSEMDNKATVKPVISRTSSGKPVGPPLMSTNTVNVTDNAIAAVIENKQSIHAFAVAYSTAAGDMFDFPFHLVTAKHEHAKDLDAKGNQLIENNFCSFDVPSPTIDSRGRTSSATANNGKFITTADKNILEVSVPEQHVSFVTGLDLHGCVRLAPQNLPVILRFCPYLTVLRLGACNQFSSELLVSVMPLLSKLRQLDFDYCISVDDNVLAAIGRFCPLLNRLSFVGCYKITDRGISEEGLFNQCTNIRRLNLRGCRDVSNQGILSIARRCLHLRELTLSGLTTLSAETLGQVIVQCRRLTRFKAELWFDIAQGNDADTPSDATKKSYRLLGSVRGAIRYIRSILPKDSPLMDLLALRYKDPLINANSGMNQLAGEPLPMDEVRMSEGADMMTPPLKRRGDTESQESIDRNDIMQMGALGLNLEGTLTGSSSSSSSSLAASRILVPPPSPPTDATSGIVSHYGPTILIDGIPTEAVRHPIPEPSDWLAGGESDME